MTAVRRNLQIQDSGFKVISGCAGGCASRLPVHRVLMSVSEVVKGMQVVFETNGDQDNSFIGVVETGEQIKMQRRNKVNVMDLMLDGSKKSAGFRGRGPNL